MKILMLIPPTDLDKSYGDLKSLNHILPGIGPAYIAAVLRKNGYDVSVLDAYVQALTPEKTVDEIILANPDILAVSLLTTSAPAIEKVVKLVRQKAPGIIIVMGNIHASVFAEDLLKSGYAEYIVHREGEIVMTELLGKIQQGADPDDVQGISFMKNGQYCHTPPNPLIEDLDTLPYPAWDLFPLHLYRADPRSVSTDKSVKIASLPILATRGCPSACTFCSSRSSRSLGSRYRMREPGKIAEEMAYMHDKFGVKSFFFADLSFPLIKKHGMDVCQEIINLGLHKKITWRCEMRVKPISRDLLEIMKEANCDRVMFGIESGNDFILKKIKKGFSKKDVRHAIKLCRETNMDIDGMFMFGLPEETKEMAEDTLQFALELNPRYVSTNLFVPYPGCDLYDDLTDQNKIDMRDLGSFTSYPAYGSARPVFIPDGWTEDDLVKFQKRFARRFYLRPRFLWRQLMDFRFEHIDLYWKALKNIAAPNTPKLNNVKTSAFSKNTDNTKAC